MLNETLKLLECEIEDLKKENKELKNKLEEADKYAVLQKIRNGEF